MWGVKLGVFNYSESIASICFARKTFLGQEMAPQNDGLVMSHQFSGEIPVFWGLFLAQGMFFMQNKCLQWIQTN